jgi:hypothetical protein
MATEHPKTRALLQNTFTQFMEQLDDNDRSSQYPGADEGTRPVLDALLPAAK